MAALSHIAFPAVGANCRMAVGGLLQATLRRVSALHVTGTGRQELAVGRDRH
ncbi:hypothetical protein PENANT_c127G10847 [Penicillium antarcticum]|uniref:Uncharacterized protein n=1 Tax=Penicillium antarcticum TaxID=416450 RepID=A0A1V6PGW2_9EURO|nr:hypothetical protein PENANT_c127G10847 [Penicillium antarcticum]